MTGKIAEVKFGEQPRAVLHTSMGDMTLELLTDKAPRTCENFVRLAANGFYDGLTFHRVMKDFMVQGGCPKGDGTGGPGYTIKPEFNDTPHVRGVVSMARSNDPHSAGSQFFIVHGEARYLDFQYAAFARVVEGDEVLERIATTDVEESRFRELSKPRIQIFINRIELEDVDVAEASSESSREPEAKAEAEPEARDDDSDRSDDASGGSDDDAQKPKAKKKSSKKKSSSRRSSSKDDKSEKSEKSEKDDSGDDERDDDSGGEAKAKSTKKKTTKKKSASRTSKGRKKAPARKAKSED